MMRQRIRVELTLTIEGDDLFKARDAVHQQVVAMSRTSAWKQAGLGYDGIRRTTTEAGSTFVTGRSPLDRGSRTTRRHL